MIHMPIAKARSQAFLVLSLGPLVPWPSTASAENQGPARPAPNAAGVVPCWRPPQRQPQQPDVTHRSAHVAHPDDKQRHSREKFLTFQ